jgi:HTH-type transcriptional repressor of NAD biosynthesis genes
MNPDLARLAGARRYDLTLLTAHDFGFVQDGTRESEQVRDDMLRWFHAALGRTGQPFVEIRGAQAERLATDTALIDPLLELQAL